MATAHRFHQTLCAIFKGASGEGLRLAVVNAGTLHRQVGGYSGRGHRMPACCSAMHSEMQYGDSILATPPKGQGASLTIRYVLPKTINVSN